MMNIAITTRNLEELMFDMIYVMKVPDIAAHDESCNSPLNNALHVVHCLLGARLHLGSRSC